MDKAHFFTVVRKSVFGGRMNQGQVDGCNYILTGFEDHYSGRNGDYRWLAYELGTTFHETAHTMKPIAEIGKGKGRSYGKPTKYAGQVAYGRGFVQLTWAYNYERADKELGLNGFLLEDFDRALQPAIAARIMFAGMEEGWFTGKKLADYFNKDKTDWINARRIINGLDRAEKIAGYSKEFFVALLAVPPT